MFLKLDLRLRWFTFTEVSCEFCKVFKVKVKSSLVTSETNVGNFLVWNVTLSAIPVVTKKSAKKRSEISSKPALSSMTCMTPVFHEQPWDPQINSYPLITLSQSWQAFIPNQFNINSFQKRLSKLQLDSMITKEFLQIVGFRSSPFSEITISF